MCKGNKISAHHQLVESRIVDIVSPIQPYQCRQHCPSSEETGRQIGYMLGCRRRRVDRSGVVNAPGEIEGRVALNRVSNAGDSDLQLLLAGLISVCYEGHDQKPNTRDVRSGFAKSTDAKQNTRVTKDTRLECITYKENPFWQKTLRLRKIG